MNCARCGQPIRTLSNLTVTVTVTSAPPIRFENYEVCDGCALATGGVPWALAQKRDGLVLQRCRRCHWQAEVQGARLERACPACEKLKK